MAGLISTNTLCTQCNIETADLNGPCDKTILAYKWRWEVHRCHGELDQFIHSFLTPCGAAAGAARCRPALPGASADTTGADSFHTQFHPRWGQSAMGPCQANTTEQCTTSLNETLRVE